MLKGSVSGVLLVVSLGTVLLFSGCGGDNDQTVYLWVTERATWNPAATRIAFAALGGNGVRYVYSITDRGSNLTLLTPTDNDADLTDEGGMQPAWAPNGNDLAIVARRGGTQALFLIDPINGASRRETRVTNDSLTVPGSDAQPSWSADSNQLVYVSTKNSPSGRWEIHIINRDGSGDRLVARADDDKDAQWPIFHPTDPTKIIYQSGRSEAGADTSLRILDIQTGVTTPIGNTEGNGFREEQPSAISTANGIVIAFASNRNGDFDIWTMNIDGSGATDVTNDPRSEGYPVWAPDGSRILFIRANEIWTIAPNGTNQKRLTQRYQTQ